MSETWTAIGSSARIRNRLESLPISTWHARLFVVCALTLLCDAADQFLIIAIAPLLIREWGITAVDVGLIAGATGVGGIIGAPLFGFLADRIGRRTCMMLSVAIYSVLTGLAAFANNVTEMVAIRAFAGIGLGGIVPVALAYVGEYSPPNWRGRIIAWWNSMFPFGISAAAAVGLFVIVPYGWRWGFAVGAVPVILIPFILWLPESVRYLVAKGRSDEANKTIQRVERAVLGAEKAATIAAAHRGGIDAEAASRTRQIPSLSGWRAVALMSTRGMRRSMIASGVLWFLPSSILLSQFFAVFLTQSKGMELRPAIALVTATSVLGPLGQFTAGFLSDWVGRKATLTLALVLLGTMPFGAFEIASSQSTVYLCLGLTWIAMSAIYGTAFGYTAEQLPTELRAGGLGIFEALRRTGNAVGPPAIGLFYGLLGLPAVLWIALGSCLFTVAVVLVLGRETRGSPMAELEEITAAAELG
jgi:MFS transporter, putative metabolite:H+ symporter